MFPHRQHSLKMTEDIIQKMEIHAECGCGRHRYRFNSSVRLCSIWLSLDNSPLKSSSSSSMGRWVLVFCVVRRMISAWKHWMFVSVCFGWQWRHPNCTVCMCCNEGCSSPAKQSHRIRHPYSHRGSFRWELCSYVFLFQLINFWCEICSRGNLPVTKQNSKIIPIVRSH